jgi:hypothetical protein
MELKIITPEDRFLKLIEFNYEELKQELSLRLEKYKGLTYTEDEIKLAKTDRATLNKFKDAIETKRKEVKNICLEPYNAFEARIKELVGLVETPIGEIDKQVKGFEETQKQEKKKAIETFFDEKVGDLKEILPFAKLWNPKWLNATPVLSKVKEEISSELDRVNQDLGIIESLNSKFDSEMKRKYFENLVLNEAFAVKTNLEDLEKAGEERKAKQELARKEAEERRSKEELARKELEEQKVKEESERREVVVPHIRQVVKAPEEFAVIEEVIEVPEIEAEPELSEIAFKMWVTEEQRQELRNWIIKNKIKVERV